MVDERSENYACKAKEKFNININLSELSLYVFESVELELALTSDDGDGKSPFDYPILLLSGNSINLFHTRNLKYDLGAQIS